MRLDRVNSVAVRAYRSLPVRLRNCLPMDALLKILRNLIVALAAGQRHVEFEDRRFCVFGVENFMRAMAVRANRSFFRARGNCVSVHARRIRSNHLRALATIFHDEFLAMARPTGGGNIGVMHPRFWIACGQQLMRTAVAINAAGGMRVAPLHSLTVKAAVIGGLLIGVAGRAGNFLRSGFVRCALYVRMAINAGKHAAVNRILEGLRVDMQADSLAVDVVRQAGVTVAGETFISGRFLGWFGGGVGA